MTLPVYSTGTVSVANLGTVVTGSGGLWSGINAREGDFFCRADGVAVITEVTDATHLQITPWPGATVSGGTYAIAQNYVGRVVGVAAAEDVGVMLEKLHTDGLPFIVGTDETVPDPSYGDEGQLAFKPSTGEWWTKSGGIWVPSAGLSALGYGGSSATSVTIGTGNKSFATQPELAYNGARVRAASAANQNNFMVGTAVYSGTTLTVNVDKTGGSGSYADWLFSVAGDTGPPGATGATGQPGAAGGTFPDAPSDTVLYGRQSATPGGAMTWAAASSSGGVAGDVTKYGASGSGLTTTGTMAAGSNALALASGLDFKNGAGVVVYGAGAAASVGAPTGLLLSILNTPYTATIITYAFASIDNAGGIGPYVLGALNSVPLAQLGVYQAGTAGIKMNQLTWTMGSGSPLATVIWRAVDSGAYVLLGCFIGTSIFDAGLPAVSIPGIPATPAMSNDWLATTVTAGGGTASLTLAASAVSAVSGARVQHDDTAAINTAMAGNAAVMFPPGTYNVRGLQIPSSVKSVTGAGNGASIITSYAQTANSLGTGVSAAMASSRLFMSGMKIVAANPAAYKGFELYQAVNSALLANEFAGSIALMLQSCTSTLVSENQITGWFDQGISNINSTDTLINDNIVGPISAQIGAVALTATPVGSGYVWGAGINSVGSVGIEVSSNIIRLNGGSWGVSVQNPGGIVTNNVIICTGREAISAQDNFQITGNYCSWYSAGNGNKSCYDFGMSIEDDTVNNTTAGHIGGNMIINSGFSAIGIYGSGAASKLQNISISGNTIVGSNQINAYTCGIDLTGGNVSNIIVGSNSFVTPGPYMAYAVGETNDNGFGIPNGNIIDTQLGARGSAGMLLIAGSTTVFADDLGAFKAYNPVVGVSQASGAVVASAYGRYQVSGKRVFLSVQVNISGTFTNGVLSTVSLPSPTASAGGWLMVGRENVSTGNFWLAELYNSVTTMQPFNSSTGGNNTVLSGWTIVFSGWYEKA